LKKAIAILFAILLVGGTLTACGSVGAPATDTPATDTPATDTPADTTTPPADTTAGSPEIFLISDSGSIDDRSFNQASWEGITRFGDENNIAYQVIQPTTSDTTAFLDNIQIAVNGGAKIIVVSGFLFEEAVFIAQDQYPDVKFILIDGAPNDANPDFAQRVFKTGDNTVGVSFAEQQAGFLAGYAAVMEGKTELGFMGGMAVPPVVRFGYGFLQGAEYAASKLGLAPGSINIKYHYTGTFQAGPDIVTAAAGWFSQGTEVIFACGGAIGNSIMQAAEQNNGLVIGVDVDQSSQSQTVITSAMKEISNAVYDLLNDFYFGTFPGGQNVVFDATNDGVGLPMETSKFTQFTQEQYDTIFAQLKSGEITVKGDADAQLDTLAADLGLSIVTVNVIN